MRATKIVATLGPASESPAVLRALIAEGLDVARLNFSHATHEWHARMAAQVRRLAAEAGRPVAILQDLAGPKIRTGPIAGGQVELRVGQEIVLTSREVPGGEREVGLTYKELPRDVEPGDRMLLSDGALELEVLATTATDIRCRVLVGGPLSSHKGINLPSRSLGAESPTPKDLEDLDFGVRLGVDFVALSFVRGPEEIERARRRLRAAGAAGTPLIAKIEKQEALARIDEILPAVEGIMVARGDLGVEIPIERIPGVQKRLIAQANRAGKLVITATQMLRSMVENPRPTRAEVTDVANAVLDGTDAVMLSEETAVGRDPAAVVRMMAKIVEEAERVPSPPARAGCPEGGGDGAAEAVAAAAAQMAERLEAAAILTLTISGSTTRLVARCRPRAPILAVTPDERTWRRLAPVRGAVPVLAPGFEDGEGGPAADTGGGRIVERAIATAQAAGYLREGQTVVVTAGLPLHVPGITNLLRVVRVGRAPEGGDKPCV